VPGRQQFVTFAVGDLLFGIEVDQVQEVLRPQEITRVPLAPPVVRGLINLRGQIVAALDLRRRLDLDPAALDEPFVNVVIHTQDGPVSLLVDEIDEVVEAGEEAFEDPPETLKGNARTVTRGVYKLAGRLMHVLDAEKVVSHEGNPAA
jgi:purine-binding chemotaxis protein CheW